MNWRVPREDGPEPLPPEELLRLRARAGAPPRPDTRHRHISAAMTEARAHRSHPSGTHALARRGARVIAGVAGIIVVTSSLAGAQILPAPARAITAVVSERLIPGFQAPEPEPKSHEDPGPEGAGTPPPGPAAAVQAEDPSARRSEKEADVEPGVTTTETAPSTSTTAKPSTTTSSPTSTSTSSSTSTSTSTTTEPTTTTTEPTTTTTAPTTTTTSTTAAPPTTAGKPPVAPAFAGDGTARGYRPGERS